MRVSLLVFLILAVLLSACQPGAIAETGPQPAAAVLANRVEALATARPTATRAPAGVTRSASATPAPTASSTPTPEPAGVIRVDTLEQEIYPFPANGNCSLAEAISAANLLQPVDGCAAGVDEQTVIELMPGTYRLAKPEPLPPQREGVFHTSPALSALPVIARSLTLRGSGAVLSREGAAEPFRIMEILKGDVTLQDLTLQGGDAGPDAWGGGVLAQNSVLRLKNVHFLKNRAENGAGLHASSADVYVEDSTFVENQAGLMGGGLYLSTANATVNGARFQGNQAEGSGGGVYARRVTMQISDTLFKGNIARENWGGAAMIEGSTASILRTQFYHNRAGRIGGAAAFSLIGMQEDVDAIAEDPLVKVMQDPNIQKLATQIPGFTATLQAAPGGMFKPIKLDIQVHESCFQGNQTDYPGKTNWASALSGTSLAENNYYGDPSGPGGRGPGKGDQVGKKVVFIPFLTEPPGHCDQLPE